MVAASSLYGSRAPVSLTAPLTNGDVIKTVVTANGGPNGTETLSGALTANTYLEIVSVTGSGWLTLCGVRAADATSRTMGLKIVIDGTTVLDDVSAANTTDGLGWFGVGVSTTDATKPYAALEKWPFHASLSLQIKSSITETDKIELIHALAI